MLDERDMNADDGIMAAILRMEAAKDAVKSSGSVVPIEAGHFPRRGPGSYEAAVRQQAQRRNIQAKLDAAAAAPMPGEDTRIAEFREILWSATPRDAPRPGGRAPLELISSRDQLGAAPNGRGFSFMPASEKFTTDFGPVA